MSRRTLAFALALPGMTLLGACGVGPDALTPARLEVDGDRPALGSIQTRDRVVSFRGGPDGPRFTVRDSGGNVLATDLRSDELAAFDPALHRLVRGVASRTAEPPVLWAD